ALVVRSRTKVTAKALAAGTTLKVVGRAGVGVDNIDVPAALARGITVVNSPLAATVAVAELTLGLMLALAREIPRADAGLKKGEWLKSGLNGVELYGKTLGLVAVGRIGAAVAGRAGAMGMRVMAYDAFLSPEDIRQRQAHPSTLDELFAASDFISIHSPLTPQTKSLISTAAFEQMKRGVRIICAARGGVVDEAALLVALESGKVAGVALDVFAVEPPGMSPLATHPKVICTPHIGARTAEAQDRAGVDIAEEVLAVLNGREPRWKVN
ncbi:MAG: phosphoglycerate dehydrogenase, partial [Chloroflexi bacterium]|nr:phosphoglycerate dehydrogenase [Chloroflexota bacterium]